MINLDKKEKIYNLIQAYPEIQEIMAELGFSDILKPGMLQSMGRIMTIEKGARIKGIEMKEIEGAFLDKGYQLN